MRMIKTIIALFFCALLVACGTDTSSGDRATASDENGFGGEPTPGVSISTSSGTVSDRAGFSMRLTDAPIDGLTRAVITFAAVEMQLKKGGWSKYTLPEPLAIDLLALQGLTTADLLLHMPIEPGEYKWVRFYLDDSPMANWVELKSGGTAELDIKKAASKGIKLKQKFTIPDDGLVNFTVDFDLRKSIKLKKKTGEYRFKPKMRLVVDNNVGFVRGTIDGSLLVAPGCSDANVDSHNSAYVYDGNDAITDDINEKSSTNNEPLTTTSINYDETSGLYVYEAAFLPPGEYTIALTCSADLDDLEKDDNLPFFYTENIEILVSDTTFLRP